MGIKIGDSMVETQTIDVEHVQKILNNCPNYDIIVNSEFPFEDTFLPVPEKWHEYLTQVFGNYMKLPPIEQQKGLHLLSVDFGKY